MSLPGKPNEVPPYWPFPAEKGFFRHFWNCGSAITLISVSMLNKLWLTRLNYANIHRVDNLHRLVEKRGDETALVTVSNHYSCLDDPVLWGCLRWRAILRPSSLRWGLAAHDICFTKKWHGIVFGLGRGAPVIRGDGVYQQGVDFVLDKLNDGGWLHIFPEGRVNMEKTFIRLKWGVGRVVAECQRKVVVLPFYHVGMDDILPNYTYIPQIKKRVTILFGNPMEFDQRLENWRKSGWTAEKIRKEITDAIQDELERLKVEAYRFHISDNNLKWPIMVKIDLIVGSSILIYFATMITEIVSSVPIGLTQSQFHGNCILGASTKYYSNHTMLITAYGHPSSCGYCTYLTIFTVLYALAYGSYSAYALYKSSENATLMWVLPAIMVCGLLFCVKFISSCILSIGFSQFCKYVTQSDAINNCKDGETSTWADHVNQIGSVEYYTNMTTAQSASWFCVFEWFLLTGLAILHYRRNLSIRSTGHVVGGFGANDTEGIVSNEVLPGGTT